MPPTGNKGRAGPKRLCVLQRRVKFDDVSAVHNLIQDRDRWFISRRANLFVGVFTVAPTHGGFCLNSDLLRACRRSSLKLKETPSRYDGVSTGDANCRTRLRAATNNIDTAPK